MGVFPHVVGKDPSGAQVGEKYPIEHLNFAKTGERKGILKSKTLWSSVTFLLYHSRVILFSVFWPTFDVQEFGVASIKMYTDTTKSKT